MVSPINNSFNKANILDKLNAKAINLKYELNKKRLKYISHISFVIPLLYVLPINPAVTKR